MTQAVEVLNRYGTDLVGEPRGSESECTAGFECFLNVVRALGMGSCISEAGGGGGSPPLLPDSNNLDGGKRRRLKGSSSFDYKVVPGRMFLNGSSDVASLYCKQGKKGINQDAMLVWEDFGSKEGTIFCGVFDGHGPYGHRVAKRVRDSFPLKLIAQWDLHHKNKDGHSDHSSAAGSYNSENGFRLVDEKPSDNELDGASTILTLRESFLKACKFMDKELKLHPDIDCFCSGTTAVTLIKQGQDLVIGNVGDSRAVLGTRDHNDSLMAVQLTIDLKPNLPREEERIKLRRGRVFSLPNEPDVSRVWLPNSDFPGLAMARAFGDFCLKDFGLIAVPDVSHHRLTEKDEFVVLATDGIWDVLSNEEVVDIVASSAQSSAARTLVESAVKAWKTKYPFCKIDDCAAVCLFFDSSSELKSAYETDELIPEASIDQSEQSSLLGEKGIGAEAENHQQ
ncbi:hypothetical protein RIF29_14189 [Crotalaria pallida]|uniref:PPM-type phosphatase domain-containing protein n=1 Tax=Crotalaria pallida TaxID=3830 RepID=A0AAN9IA30_CROPI